MHQYIQYNTLGDLPKSKAKDEVEGNDFIIKIKNTNLRIDNYTNLGILFLLSAIDNFSKIN